MIKGRFKKFALRVAETAAILTLVLIFFSFFLGILNLAFPTGKGLNIFTGEDTLYSPVESVRELLLSRGDEEGGLDDNRTVAAVLTRIENRVKNRRADKITWKNAREGMNLYNRDAVQTLSYSSAVIRFDENNHIKLGNNSLIVIRSMEKDLLFNEKRSFMVMVDGELSGRIVASKGESVHLEIVTPSAVTRIKTRKQSDGIAEFKMKITADKSSAITMLHGVAEVVAKDRKVIVETSETVYIPLDSLPVLLKATLKPVRLLSPAPSKRFYYRDLSPKIIFSWEAMKGAKAYRFVMARDADFRELVVDEDISKTEFVYGNMKRGNYFWRVNALDGIEEGPYSLTRRVTLTQDSEAPVLEVKIPSESLKKKNLAMSGLTEPLSRVFIMGKEVAVSHNGEFTSNLELAPGINVIVVEAVDLAGNVTYSSHLVTRKL